MGPLRKAIDLGADGVIVRCYACLNLRVFKAAEALKRFGPEAWTSDIYKRCRCKCGAREAMRGDGARKVRAVPQPVTTLICIRVARPQVG